MSQPLVTTSLIEGLRTLLLAAGFTSVTIGPWAQDAPDTALSITPYPLTDDMLVGTILSAVQVRIRRAAAERDQILDDQERILLAICSTPMRAIGGITVSVAWRQMSAPLGLDPQGRNEIADTYYLRYDRLGLAG